MSARKFIASLPAWDKVCSLEAAFSNVAQKEELLAAEVYLPVPEGTNMANLRTVQIRPPFERASRLTVVDVSRLRVS